MKLKRLMVSFCRAACAAAFRRFISELFAFNEYYVVCSIWLMCTNEYASSTTAVTATVTSVVDDD